jgi:hypothetical protein
MHCVSPNYLLEFDVILSTPLFQWGIDYILSPFILWAHQHLVCELHPRERTWLRIAHCNIFTVFTIPRFSLPGHDISFEYRLVDEALGFPRNLMVLPYSKKYYHKTCRIYYHSTFSPLYNKGQGRNQRELMTRAY